MSVATGIKLYSWEACPYCQRVEAAFDAMDLEYERIEVGREMDQVHELTGVRQVPMIVDDRHGVMMFESMDIIAYAKKQYLTA